MPVKRTIAGTILCVLAALLLLVSGCLEMPEPEYAGSITEGILTGMRDNDYASYSEYFDETLKEALPEDQFYDTNTMLKGKIGEYQGEKSFKNTMTKDEFISVVYQAKFSGEPKGVTVRVVFQEIDGTVYVSGLWLDSPNLRK